MRKKDISFAELLVCPDCHSHLIGGRSSFYCTVCKNKFSFIKGIPVILPANFKQSPDYFFKKSQIGFFDKWCSIKKRRKSTLTAFEKFFSAEVGNKKVNYSEEEMTKLVNLLPKNSWILELGCGAGEHSEFMAKIRNDINLVMIDISLKSILETKKRLSCSKLKGNYHFLVADAENLPFENNSFMGITAIMFFHHLFSLDKTFLEIKRVLKPEGKCLVIDLLSNNPLVIFSRKLFKRFPARIKQRFIDDYVLENGEIPDVKIHSLKELKKSINNSGFKIWREVSYDLFLIIFSGLGVAFPFLKPLFTEKILNLLYNLEKDLLRKRFFNNFAGARTLWLSH